MLYEYEIFFRLRYGVEDSLYAYTTSQAIDIISKLKKRDDIVNISYRQKGYTERVKVL